MEVARHSRGHGADSPALGGVLPGRRASRGPACATRRRARPASSPPLPCPRDGAFLSDTTLELHLDDDEEPTVVHLPPRSSTGVLQADRAGRHPSGPIRILYRAKAQYPGGLHTLRNTINPDYKAWYAIHDSRRTWGRPSRDGCSTGDHQPHPLPPERLDSVLGGRPAAHRRRPGPGRRRRPERRPRHDEDKSRAAVAAIPLAPKRSER